MKGIWKNYIYIEMQTNALNEIILTNSLLNIFLQQNVYECNFRIKMYALMQELIVSLYTKIQPYYPSKK